MKRKRILKALALLAVAALKLFVSCSGNIMDDVSDTLVYATFDKNSRATSTYTQTVTLKDIGEVYWTYTATKKDNAGTTGATSDEIAVKSSFDTGLDGAIGPFSQGEWEFTVYGYKNGTDSAKSGDSDAVKVGETSYYSGLIYQGSGNATLSTGTQTNPDPIDVIISLLADGYGTFEIANTSDFKWKTSGGDISKNGLTMYLVLYGRVEDGTSGKGEYQRDFVKLAYKEETSSYEITEGTTTSWPESWSGSSNIYCYIVSVSRSVTSPTWSDVKYVYAESPALLVKIYDGQTTSLEANVIEGSFAWGEFNGTIESYTQSSVTETVDKDSDTEITLPVSPASAADETINASVGTTIKLPKEISSIANNSYVTMDVKATPILDAYNSFEITSETRALGALDLSVKAVSSDGSEEPLESFKDSNGSNVEVTITTYIAKGMTNVVLTYTKEDGTTETWNERANSAKDSAIKAPSEGTEGVCFYDAETGQLVYKTTHFSTFLVGADQNVYDANSGIAYVLKTTDNGTTYHIYDKDGKIIKESSSDTDTGIYSSAKLGANLVLLNCALSNNVPDAFVSDCNTDDEDKRTWSVIHHNCENQSANYCHEKYSSYFSSGYGTKVEPYMIANKKQFQNISELSGNYNESDGKYAYFKISDDYPDSEKDFSNWKSVSLDGSFDGNNLKIENLDDALFYEIHTEPKTQLPSDNTNDVYSVKNLEINAHILGQGAISPVVAYVGVGKFEMKNVQVHGYIEGSIHVSSFVAYGPGEYDTSGKTYAGEMVFTDCNSDATVIAKTGVAAGFVAHPMLSEDGKIYLKSSKYTGTLKATKLEDCKYAEGLSTTAKIYDDIESSDATSLYELKEDTDETINGATCKNAEMISVKDIDILTQNIKYGDAVVIDAKSNAKYAIVALEISPGPGCYTAVCMTENLEAVNNKFTTNEIKYFQVRINPEDGTKTGPNGNYYDVVFANFSTLDADSIVRFTQYSENMELIGITNVEFGDKTSS